LSKNLTDLGQNGRFPIDNGVVLMGVVDEYDILEENEVWVSLDQETKVENLDESDSEQDITSLSLITTKIDLQNQSTELDSNEQSCQESEVQNPKNLDGKRAFVAKNPCLYPGDIRLVTIRSNKSEYYKKLWSLKNVIVFSSKGSRPVFDMTSGGDLDGDLYFLSWDERIIYNSVEKKSGTKSVERTVEKTDKDAVE
ncbi:RNA-directed RNA polymerase QDE-1, partial [Pseudoloma neurophilia]